ncbi:MAG: PEP-CTERM sorting domain-containing protein [Acidobacteriia bacterium]|nr:PEP-CTERM sorting domain-containing protein [Terriglobia bacterium]
MERPGAARPAVSDQRRIDGRRSGSRARDNKGGISLGSKSNLLVPEPGTLGLLGTGLLGLAGTIRRKLFSA